MKTMSVDNYQKLDRRAIARSLFRLEPSSFNLQFSEDLLDDKPEGDRDRFWHPNNSGQIPLHVITDNPISCEGCGSCCETISMPPSFEAGCWEEVPVWFPNSEDGKRFYSMPEQARQEVKERYIKMAGKRFTNEPCVWLDSETKRCRWYEWRPWACINFIPGNDMCERLRMYTSKIIELGNATPNQYFREINVLVKIRGGDCLV